MYFCDTGLAAYLLGIETPGQMQRDPLMGNIFENLVVAEAFKTRFNYGAEPNLYFFRNSNGLEVDLILKENENLNLFEVKSGKSLNDEFTKNMQKFLKMNSIEIEKNNSKGTVIYSGETYRLPIRILHI